MVQHPAPDELLLDYATGSLPEPLALLVATHAALSPESRRQVRAYEELGGALLDTVEPAEMSEGALHSVLARIDAGRSEGDAPAEGAAPASDGRVPAPLCAYVAQGFDALSWCGRGGNVSEVGLLPGYPGYKTRLLRIRAGARVPQHTHAGAEYTLVLEGSFTDETGCYARGDMAIGNPELTHQPVAGKECDCICLAVTDAPLKLTGPLGRLLNYFVEM